MSEFDAVETAAPHALSLARARLAVRVALGAIDLAIALFPDELREMKILDDLTLCRKVLGRATD